MLAHILSRYWWTMLFRGLLWILFGVFTFMNPTMSMLTLTLLFGAFVFFDGIGHLVSAFGGSREHEHWWLLLLMGLAGICVGVLTFFNPGVTALALVFYIAMWAVVTGVLEIVTAIRLRKEVSGEFWLGLAGLLSIAFGVMIAARPGVGALSLLWLIGAYAIVFGVIEIVLSFEARGFVRRISTAVKG